MQTVNAWRSPVLTYNVELVLRKGKTKRSKRTLSRMVQVQAHNRLEAESRLQKRYRNNDKIVQMNFTDGDQQ